MKSTGALAGLLALHLLLIVLSINLVAEHFPLFITGPTTPQLFAAIETTAIIACVAPLFYLAEFSFGYVVGFCMYGMVAGFLVISHSTQLPYDHQLARLSAMFALVAFLIPMLFLRANVNTRLVLTEQWFELLLIGLLIFTVAVLIWSGVYGFHFMGPFDSINVRAETIRPPLLSYLDGICIGAVLPFVFACYALRKRWILAGISCAIAFAFYPVLLNKTTLFLVPWMIFINLLYRYVNPKAATVLSIVLPTTIGTILYVVTKPIAPIVGHYALGFINLRMFAVPSVALDFYYSFFHNHPLTGFCQISILKPWMKCPYAQQLGIVFADEYHLGNFNASLFATEGIASLGLLWAPLGTFVCGVILSVGNVASGRLQPAMIAGSSCVIVQTLLNVPLSTSLITNGCSVLFLLWTITPEVKTAP